jgi:hypothetical protein
MQTTEIQATLTLARPKIKTPAELSVRVVLTNSTSRPIRLNTLFFDYTSIMLKVRRDDGTPVHSGPPPIPPLDDGSVARVVIAPGDVLAFTYSGSNYFAQAVPPGRYQVRFRHEAVDATHGDWTGTVETEWVPFEVAP